MVMVMSGLSIPFPRAEVSQKDRDYRRLGVLLVWAGHGAMQVRRYSSRD